MTSASASTSTSEVYNHLNKGWKSTCRIILGEEIGELKEYDEWLKEHMPVVGERKSHISGKGVAFAIDDYSKSADFISMDEVKAKAIDPLTINEIKDIDSIVEAISGKWEYVGNKVLGNSKFVEAADLIIDSQYVLDNSNTQRMMYSYATFNANDNKYCFGSGQFGFSEFVIKFFRSTNNKRCFSSFTINDSSDIYCSNHCYACHDMIFSFHQINKKCCIGNLELPKEKYTALKTKLISEIREETKKNKRFPALFEIIPNKPSPSVSISVPPVAQKEDMSQIDKAFSSTFKVLFKKEPGKISDYEQWLSNHVVQAREVKTQFGGITYLPNMTNIRFFSALPDKRLVNYDEAMELGKLHMEESDVGNLDKIKEWVANTGFLVAAFSSGQNSNIIKSVNLYNTSNMYRVYTGASSEYCGVVSWALFNSKYLFGCHWLLGSQYNMKCFSSINLNRCVELDTCTNCSDSFFSHNCEGLSDAMFCFNVKSKRYAIGNTQLPPEQYRKIKDVLVEQMANEILRTKKLRYDIYNVGGARK
jgi:hypothetical protein